MRQIVFMILSVCLLSSCQKGDSLLERDPSDDRGAKIRMVVGSTIFTGWLYDNATAKAIFDVLPITMDMREINGNEKYYDFPSSFPVAATRPGTVHAGDMMLYEAGTFVLFYETFSTPYSYTNIGRLDNPSALKAALGDGDVKVRFESIPEVIQYIVTYNAN